MLVFRIILSFVVLLFPSSWFRWTLVCEDVCILDFRFFKSFLCLEILFLLGILRSLLLFAYITPHFLSLNSILTSAPKLCSPNSSLVPHSCNRDFKYLQRRGWWLFENFHLADIPGSFSYVLRWEESCSKQKAEEINSNLAKSLFVCPGYPSFSVKCQFPFSLHHISIQKTG